MKQHKIVIHVLEDDADDRQRTEEFLRKADFGYEILMHENSKSLLSTLDKTIGNVIVLDYRLDEERNGLEVMREIRRDDIDEDIFLIILTGISSEDLLLQFINMRPGWFIRKQEYDKHFAELDTAIRYGIAKICKRMEREAILKKLGESLQNLDTKLNVKIE